MARLIFQMGFTKTRKLSQNVKVYINDEPVSWSAEDSGKYLTTHKDRIQKNTIWFMASWDLEPKDVLRVEVVTFLPEIGKDSERTFETLYYVDEDAPVREVSIRGVGHKAYPLIKGRFLEIGSVSEEDKRLGEISDFMNGDF